MNASERREHDTEDRLAALRRARDIVDAIPSGTFGTTLLVEKGRPCCALGHIAFATHETARDFAISEDLYDTGHALGFDDETIEAIVEANDSSDPGEREEAVLAAINGQIDALVSQRQPVPR